MNFLKLPLNALFRNVWFITLLATYFYFKTYNKYIVKWYLIVHKGGLNGWFCDRTKLNLHWEIEGLHGFHVVAGTLKNRRLFLLMHVLIDINDNLRTFHHFIWIIKKKYRVMCILNNKMLSLVVQILREESSGSGLRCFPETLVILIPERTTKERILLFK